MANTNVVDISNGEDTTLSSVYKNISKKASVHKALDFSNVGMPISNSASDKSFRQFHQTRIYVQGFNNMLHHGKSGEENGATTYLISANLPETIGYSLSSTWEAPLKQFGGATQNALMQLATGLLSKTDIGKSLGVNGSLSLANRATTLKVWGGTQPLKLKLEIPVIDDGLSTNNNNGINANLTEALEFLGSLCLPQRKSGTGFYTPPPSPLDISIRYGKNSADEIHFDTTYGRIMLQLGGILLIDRCVIEGVQVNYPNTKTLIKHTYSQSLRPGNSGSSYLTPLLAKVTIDISTIEALTANTYSQMLWLQPQGSGTFSADISGAVETVGQVKDNLANNRWSSDNQ